MSQTHILPLFLILLAPVEGEREMIFEMKTSYEEADNGTLLCYLKCKSDRIQYTVDSSIFLDLINIFPDEKFFILDGAIRNIMLECMGSNLSTKTCGENYSRCKPLISKFSNISGENSTCCLQEIYPDKSKLDWRNFLGFPEGTECLMKCIKAQTSIFNKKGEADASNVYRNTEFVDIIPEKKQTFRRCVLNGSGVHTCEEIIHLYICFFRNMKKADSREWLYP
ncbi:uncharacterized protein LOC123315568 [Coccinella septempunctata]|uniref:uncharacterized protein LOC123315568 n=1 Tax=Coccinella septempunctata TaxID=41139 RepID=UPI001D07FDE8|nr:uncharacterized protein LOC123315568 [Coccinella septempunctata]